MQEAYFCTRKFDKAICEIYLIEMGSRGSIGEGDVHIPCSSSAVLQASRCSPCSISSSRRACAWRPRTRRRRADCSNGSVLHSWDQFTHRRVIFTFCRLFRTCEDSTQNNTSCEFITTKRNEIVIEASRSAPSRSKTIGEQRVVKSEHVDKKKKSNK